MAYDALHAALVPGPRARPRVDVERILHPRSVAVFGASDSKDKFGGRIMHFLVRHGFAGEIYPINPRRAEVVGPPRLSRHRGGARAARRRDPRGARAPRSSRRCARRRRPASAAASSSRPASPRRATRARRARPSWCGSRAQTGMRHRRPELHGAHRAAPPPGALLVGRARHRHAARRRRSALVSQSGALMVSVFDRAATDGIGFRYGVSLGNQVDLEICDFLEYMVEEPRDRRRSACTSRGCSTARASGAACAAARAAGKPRAGREDRPHRRPA